MPPSEQQGHTYAISVSTFLQHPHFGKMVHADLFLQILWRYRDQRKFLLHGFAIMTDHVHLLITPTDTSLAKCVQLIKGGYSFAARTQTQEEIWHSGYHEHRVRDLADIVNQLHYIANNPAAASVSRDYRYVHTHPQHASSLDPCPIRLQQGSGL